MAGTTGNFGNFNGCRKLSGPFQFIFILQPKMTKIIPIYKTCNPLQGSVKQCMCVRQAVDMGIINFPVLWKAYFYRISNLTWNKTFVMEFQHIWGKPLLFFGGTPKMPCG